MNYKKEKKIFKFFYSNFFIAILSVVMIFFVYNLLNIFPKVTETGQNKKEIQNEFMKLKDQEEKLKVEIEKLQTEQGIAENLREKFRVAEAGEGLIVIVDEINDSSDQTKKSSSQNFFNFLKNIFK